MNLTVVNYRWDPTIVNYRWINPTVVNYHRE